MLIFVYFDQLVIIKCSREYALMIKNRTSGMSRIYIYHMTDADEYL